MRWLLLLACLCGCIAPQPVLLPPTGDDVTIFVHGYRASFLATATGETAYVTPSQGLSLGDRSLAFPFEGQRDFPRYGPLTVTGPFTTLTAIPFFYVRDPYGSWMEWAKRELPGFVVFAYDWRQDIRASGQQLCERIEALGPARRVRLVGHSMGGLVVHACLRRGSEAVKKAVTRAAFVGTPFRGGPGQLHDLQFGTITGANERLLDIEALLTFPSAWQLLPPTTDYFFDDLGRPIEVPVLSAEAWVDRGWGVFGSEVVRNNPAYRGELERRLEDHRSFWREMGDVEGLPPSFKSLVVLGTGRLTLHSWKVKSDGSIAQKRFFEADGDGSILITGALPPKPMSYEVAAVKTEHSELLNDLAVREVLREFFAP
jgi:pimeloyl-ACP methyl ester carboxylesterase